MACVGRVGVYPSELCYIFEQLCQASAIIGNVNDNDTVTLVWLKNSDTFPQVLDQFNVSRVFVDSFIFNVEMVESESSD